MCIDLLQRALSCCVFISPHELPHNQELKSVLAAVATSVLIVPGKNIYSLLGTPLLVAGLPKPTIVYIIVRYYIIVLHYIKHATLRVERKMVAGQIRFTPIYNTLSQAHYV